MNTTEKGAKGENAAALYMRSRGMRLIERNYRRNHWEIDIIAMDGDILVFAEVKARKNRSMVSGREAVTKKKQQNIINAAQLYLMEHNILDTAVRFDVAEVDLYSGDVEYIPNAFDADQ